MSDTPASFRAFLAIGVPLEVRDIVARAIHGLREKAPEVRWVARDNLHLTLHFFGALEGAALPALLPALSAVVARHPRFDLGLADKLGAFPSTERPRVIWLGVEEGEPALLALVADLASTLAELGYPVDEREHHPHLTLGRVKATRRGRRQERKRARAAGSVLDEAPTIVTELFPVDRIELMESVLSPAGPRYTVRAAFPLGAPAADDEA